MPSRVLRTRRRLSLYLIPVVLGVFGILFARGLDAPVLRGVALLVSVAGPMVAAAYILANLSSRGLLRMLLVGGVLLLMVGALGTASGISGVLDHTEGVSRDIQKLSQWTGLVSLLLGMLALLVSIVRTDEAIEEIGERFRHLADQMGEGFVLAAADGRVALVNARFLELTGLAEDEVLGHDMRDIADRLNGEFILPYLDERERGTPKEFQCSWPLGGEERHFLINSRPLFNRRGALAGVLATVRDITEQQSLSRRLERYTHGLQKLVEDRTQKLRQSEEQFRDLLLSMNEGFLTVDSQFRILFANDRIGDVLRMSPQALVGREVFEFVDAAGRGRLLGLFESAGAGTADRMQQEFLFLREGTEVPVMVAVAPVQGDAPAPDDSTSAQPRFSLVVTDISELKRMQRQVELRANELQAANEELKMLDRAKDGFLSNVTHELKTPLATVRGYVEMLESGGLGELRPAQVNALGIMERNVQRLGLLIEEMIEFSRMQIRGIQLTLALFSMRALILEAVSSVRPQAAPRHLSFETKVADEAGFVWADRKRIAQVLSILLSNAVKFSHPGGRIEVVVSRREGNSVAISVVDRGIGIAQGYHERIFDKFFQVDSSHTRRYEGTGIGLSIAKNIAEAHGGHIELESAPNAGSTFTLVLPHAVFDTQYDVPAEWRLESMRVVLADDDDEARKALSGVLARAGCEVTAVRSGHECVRVARESAPALAIVNEVLPDLSAPATYQKLRENAEFDDTAVIVLTSRLREAAWREPGAENVAHLQKPFGPGELIAKVREVCLNEVASAVAAAPLMPGENGPAQPSVLAVDSDPDFLAWLESGLKHRHIECFTALDVNEALGVAGARRPDVIFVDVDAANGGAAEMLRRLNDAQSTRGVPVYVLTGLPADYSKGLGVAGALRKPFSLGEVVDIVLGPRVHS